MISSSIDSLQAAVLALIQGLTEFLPISSSAHLALMPLLTDWPDQGLAFDCILHLGTLTAVVYYFRIDLARMCAGFARTIRARSWQADADGKMAWFILLATIPVGLAGLAFKDLVEGQLRSVAVIAVASIVFGLLLWWADARHKKSRNAQDWTFSQAMLVGLAQAVALIPGTSRSGITMTAALMLGFSRQEAARFSFLLSIPVIFLAGGLKIKDMIEQSQLGIGIAELAIGYCLSVAFAYLCIHYFLRFIERMGMLPFVLYRIALGAILLLAS